jgi:hypothetical protein
MVVRCSTLKRGSRYESGHVFHHSLWRGGLRFVRSGTSGAFVRSGAGQFGAGASQLWRAANFLRAGTECGSSTASRAGDIGK